MIVLVLGFYPLLNSLEDNMIPELLYEALKWLRTEVLMSRYKSPGSSRTGYTYIVIRWRTVAWNLDCSIQACSM